MSKYLKIMLHEPENRNSTSDLVGSLADKPLIFAGFLRQQDEAIAPSGNNGGSTFLNPKNCSCIRES